MKSQEKRAMKRHNTGYSIQRLCAWLAGLGGRQQFGPVSKAARRVKSKKLVGLVSADMPARPKIAHSRRGAGMMAKAVKATMDPLEPRILMTVSTFLYVNDNWNITNDVNV